MSTRYLGGIIRKTPLALDPALGNAANGVFTMNQYMQAVKDGTWPGFDPYFNQTVLSLHGNGTSGDQNNTFLDGSTNNFTITRNGNTTQGTFSPFSGPNGYWSNFFDGTGDFLSIANNAALDLGTGDFTIEGWWYFTDTSDQALVSKYQSGAGYVVQYQASNTTLRLVLATGSPGSDVVYSFTWALVPNSWNHIAITRSGTNGRAFVNGTQIGTTQTLITNNAGAAQPLQIGSTQTVTQLTRGYVSNFRLVKGTAVYTSAFTPNTTPLTNITNTSLLTCQSNRFVDNSTNAFAITRNGDVRVTPFSPFAPTAAYSAGTNGGSGYFDGTGDYLESASNAAFGLGSGNFTIECWVYLTANFDSTGKGIITSSFNTNFAVIGVNTGGGNRLDFYVANSLLGTGTNYISLNTWTHLAFVRSSGTTKIYFNGVEVASSGSLTGTGAAAAMYIGTLSHDTPRVMAGYVANARLVKGTAVYTGAFTPPTLPLSTSGSASASAYPSTTNVDITFSSSNTSLLCNFTNAGIFDSTAKNNLETVGNAQIDTTTKKYGTGSMEFDGSGDWLLLPNNVDQQLGTGNFTIEFWVYLATGDTGSARGLVAKGTSTTGFLVSLDSSQKVVFTFTTSTITSSGAITLDAWNHIAVVRSGTGSNQTKIYIGGTNDGTGTVSTDFNQTSVMYVGANRTGGDPMKGYIDDLRITKGVARYTANFTAQTSQWQDQ